MTAALGLVCGLVCALLLGGCGGSVPRPAGSGKSPVASSTHGTEVPGRHALGPELRARADPLLEGSDGHASVAVRDLATGRQASHGAPGHRFSTASIVKVDILAALLLQTADDHRYLSPTEDLLATRMIEESDNDAATRLWNQIGGTDALRSTNARLGLRETEPGQGSFWGLTTTTAADQLRLLAQVATPDSVLGPASRRYVERLMSNVRADQQFGVSAAADAGTVPMLKDGWLELADTHLWVLNSIGRVVHGGRPMLVAVLSDGQPDEATGTALTASLARAAVRSADTTRPVAQR